MIRLLRSISLAVHGSLSATTLASHITSNPDALLVDGAGLGVGNQRPLHAVVIRRTYASLLEISRLRLTPDSAACIANNRCTSGGTRTINLPL